MDPVTIGFDRLQILIQEFAKRVYDRLFWVTPLAVAITLLATLIVSDFKDRYGLKADDWRDGTIFLLIVFLIWTLVAGTRAFRHQSISDLMDGIARESHCLLIIMNHQPMRGMLIGGRATQPKALFS